jgi:hypothetical protein
MQSIASRQLINDDIGHKKNKIQQLDLLVASRSTTIRPEYGFSTVNRWLRVS